MPGDGERWPQLRPATDSEIASVIGDSLVTDVRDCARCGLDHGRIRFARFRRPVKDTDGRQWQLWATCPETLEPILLTVNIET